MCSNVLVSLILPIYNSEEHLAMTIESVLNQSHKEIEVLLIDDGSIDNSLKICTQYETLDDRVRVFSTENQGVSSARNFGLNIACGKYIRFIDSDDILPENSTSKLVEAAEKHNAQIVIGGFEERKFSNKNKYKIERFIKTEKVFTAEDFASNYLLFKKKKMINAPWNKLYCSHFLKNNHILFDPDIALGEDLIFNLSCFRVCEKIIAIEEVVYIYFIRNGFGLSQKFYDNKYKIYKRLLEAEKEFAEAFGVDLIDYLMTNKINEGIFQIESILRNKKIPYDEKKTLIKQSKNEWGLHDYNNKNHKLTKYNNLILHLLRLNHFFAIIFIYKVKVILKTLNT
jgi:glycosyltransferase involved in cell wall biosynthesis